MKRNKIVILATFSLGIIFIVIGLSRSAHSTTSLLGYYNTNIQAWDVALSSNGILYAVPLSLNFP